MKKGQEPESAIKYSLIPVRSEALSAYSVSNQIYFAKSVLRMSPVWLKASWNANEV